MKTCGLLGGVVGLLLASTSAHAQGAERAAEVSADKPAGDVALKTPAYSLPWQLRPIAPATGFRSDTSLAKYEDKSGGGGTTAVSFLSASYKLSSNVGFFGKVGVAGDTPPPSASGQGGLIVSNPTLGAIVSVPLGRGFRLATSLAVGIPDGAGGDPSANKSAARARSQANVARSQMDGISFATNDLGFAPAVDLAYTAKGFTVQAEVIVPYLVRVQNAKAQPEASKANFIGGLHVGYFLVPEISVGGELRYQHWLNAPLAIDQAKAGTPAADNVDNLTFAVGPRFHFKIGDSVVVRPGASYSRGIDKPTAASTPNYHVVQLDVPVTFAKF